MSRLIYDYFSADLFKSAVTIYSEALTKYGSVLSHFYFL